MNGEKHGSDSLRSNVVIKWVGIGVLLLLLAGAVYLYQVIRCIDGCGPYFNSTSVADLDADGDLDVVLSNVRHENDSIIWTTTNLWINQDGGKFTPHRLVSDGSSTAAGDFDGDGATDLFQLGYGDASLYLNPNGSQNSLPGLFGVPRLIRAPFDLTSPGNHGSVLPADLDNDGRLDVFVGNCCGGMVEGENGQKVAILSPTWLWINTVGESGLIVGKTLNLSSLGNLPMHPAMGDLDNDGDLDAFAAVQPPNRRGAYVSADRVLLNDGTGVYSDSGQRLVTAGSSGSLAAALGDLDGDGDLDVLVGKLDGAAVLINQGESQGGQTGIFADSGVSLSGEPAEAVFLADFDTDGDLDALTAGKTRATLWWNDGNAVFTASRQRLRYTERHALAVADFNGDGWVDVFSAAYDTSYQLWLNQGDGTLRK